MSARTPARGQPPIHARLTAYLLSHARAFVFSLGKIYRAPLASLMTTAVIGIALALPTGLYLALKNLQAASAGWDRGAQVSLFLEKGVDTAAARGLAQRLRAREEVADVEVIDREQALAEFRERSGFGQALDALGENPLPTVIVVHPAMAFAAPAQVERLVADLRRLPEVDLAQLDAQWLQRLYAIMELARRGVLVIAAMLGVAVILVIGNTIRLDIQNRREEIEVTKLIGATDGFIRRPFLYGGVWYGLLGGFLGLLMVEVALGLVAEPARHLAGLYASDFRLLDLEAGVAAGILGVSVLLGLGGSWLAVGRHLAEIEPR